MFVVSARLCGSSSRGIPELNFLRLVDSRVTTHYIYGHNWKSPCAKLHLSVLQPHFHVHHLCFLGGCRRNVVEENCSRFGQSRSFYIEIGKKKNFQQLSVLFFSDVCLSRNGLCQTKNIDNEKYIPICTAVHLAQMILPISRSDGT